MDKTRVDGRANRLRSSLEGVGLSCQLMSEEKISALAAGQHHQGVVAEVLRLSILDEKSLLEHLTGRDNPLLCVLEGIQDPRNLGVCLRTAEAAGVACGGIAQT